jgi:hypothetical protein
MRERAEGMRPDHEVEGVAEPLVRCLDGVARDGIRTGQRDLQVPTGQRARMAAAGNGRLSAC